jgi:hypothetical protein
MQYVESNWHANKVPTRRRRHRSIMALLAPRAAAARSITSSLAVGVSRDQIEPGRLVVCVRQSTRGRTAQPQPRGEA